jgi:hypothetical protein
VLRQVMARWRRPQALVCGECGRPLAGRPEDHLEYHGLRFCSETCLNDWWAASQW